MLEDSGWLAALAARNQTLAPLAGAATAPFVVQGAWRALTSSEPTGERYGVDR